jgi:anaerobic magnesium-protoporphyrin IX monomethyl ester cyclase
MNGARPIQKILFVRPPAHLWPILNESDNFLMPLGFPFMAAYLREREPDIEIRIVDCLPLELGWKSLEALIAEYQPDLVGVGEMIVYMKEGMRVLEIAKRLDPSVITVAGGHFHSHMPGYTLDTYQQVDIVVRYEGEATFTELVRCLGDGGDLAAVQGIAYRDEQGATRLTTPRPLLDLDTLPSPAYDLMPVDRYSPFGKLWPRAITIQASRGCPYQCNFCSWTALEGEHKLDVDGELTMIPRRRQLSVARTLQEIDILYNEHGIRYLFWTDATWNFDNEWLEELCDALIERGYDLGWWAFVRADLMLEQERLGILDKMVKAGLRHCLFGGERPTEEELAEVGKNDMSATALSEVCHLLKREYPQVFRQATFTTGIRSETTESMARLGRFTRSCALDFAAFHPLQPYPGTPLWDQANEGGWIEEEDFSNFDMFCPVMRPEAIDRAQVAALTSKVTQEFVTKQPFRYASALVSPHAIRRRLHWWFLFSIGRVMFADVSQALLGKKRFEGFSGLNKLWKPRWYDS